MDVFFFLHCNDMSFFEERVLFCACVFCKVYVFAYLLKLLVIAAFNFIVIINDKVIKQLNLKKE